jgi:hypothetical protein
MLAGLLAELQTQGNLFLGSSMGEEVICGFAPS